MFQSLFQRIHLILEVAYRLIYSLKLDFNVVVMQVLIEQHGMVSLFLSLDTVPVFKAVQSYRIIIICKFKIQVCRIELLIDLIVYQLSNSFIHNKTPPIYRDTSNIPHFSPIRQKVFCFLPVFLPCRLLFALTIIGFSLIFIYRNYFRKRAGR